MLERGNRRKKTFAEHANIQTRTTIRQIVPKDIPLVSQHFLGWLLRILDSANSLLLWSWVFLSTSYQQEGIAEFGQKAYAYFQLPTPLTSDHSIFWKSSLLWLAQLDSSPITDMCLTHSCAVYTFWRLCCG